MYISGKRFFKTADEWFASVQPDYHVRLSLLQRRSLGRVCGTYWQSGEEIFYREVCNRFIRSLSHRFCPNKNVWKRFRPILPNICCLHGKGNNKAWHLHLNIRAPEGISDVDFEKNVWDTARKNPWIPFGHHSIHVEPIRCQAKAISYTMKEGFSSVMPC